MPRLQFTTGGGAPPWTCPPDAPHAFSAPAMSPSAKEPARVAPPRTAARAAFRILATPRKEVRPKARHKARDYAARLIRAVAAPEALLCNCRDELPNFARELAGETSAEAGDW